MSHVRRSYNVALPCLPILQLTSYRRRPSSSAPAISAHVSSACKDMISLSVATSIPVSLLVFILLPFAVLLTLAHAATELRYNCGGFELGDYSSDPVALVSGDDRRFTANESISNLTVGLSHRWGSDAGFAYNFPTGNGQYDIDLIFAEIYPNAQADSRRRFDIFVEDQVAIEDLDVFAEAGANVELKRTIPDAVVEDGALSIAFRKGSVENPMVSAILIRASNGSDVSLSSFPLTDGISNNPAPDTVYDHQAHAVAGGPYKGTDYNGNGEADIFINGGLSHSHYSNPDTGESGRIVRYEWRVGDAVISTSVAFNYAFKVGTTELSLIVEDQTGDTASATTEVTVLPVTAAGAYCYYYNGVTSLPLQLMDEPRPDEGHSTNIINFFPDSFLYSKMFNDDSSTNVWAARCVTDFQSVYTTQYNFGLRYRGAGAVLYVNNGKKIVGGASTDSVSTINAKVTVSDATVSVQVLFYSGGVDEPQLALLVDDKVAPAITLSYKTAFVLPTISSLSTTQVQPQGGSQLQIVGTGFFNNITVSIGFVKDVTRTLISSTLIQIPSIPSAQDATSQTPTSTDVEAEVAVSNNAGTSNTLRVAYTANAKKGIAWEQTFFKQSDGSVYLMKQVTSVKVGPDGNYYTGALGGFVSRLNVGKDLIVNEKCDSAKLGDSRAILGMAFNPASSAIRLYVSTSQLWANTAENEAAWANGGVDTFVDSSLKSCSECLCYEQRAISGLPVSGHDHGVNALLFVNGDLLITVGGATNAGVPSDALGNGVESPLSAAILIAELSKGSSFNGQITYDDYSNPGSATQTGGDVQVYASGFRNCFGITQHTNGQIWATDNGPNLQYGDISSGCDTEQDFVTESKDEVNLVLPGAYYGHPNRNRGECVYNEGEAPKLTIASSTPGIVEYTGNAFSGTLQGQLILSKYAASGNGKTWRATIEGTSLTSVLPMSDYSDLAVENGLHGELVMPRVQSGFMAVLKPIYSYSSGSPFVIAVSPNRGKAGHRVFIGGEGFEEGLVANFGATPSSDVSLVDSNGFFCTVPSGDGTVEIVVIVNDQSSKGTTGQGGTVKFIYV